ncbi:hypothetical protein B0T21DRAFT_364242 [Apiosordaria backusii]|uniref:Chitin deacetylase n=1 Tax=Apiosordaria backusii TaxID=314023 RepID=A0AA40BMR9_9PEZI|nr:hypothetical protein B0T21DRAFT_364242 [Apiosordaria backusii]
MKLSITALAAFLSLAVAHSEHGGQHIPKILGGRKFLSEMEARRRFSRAAPEPVVNKRHPPISKAPNPQGPSNKRQENTSGRCGASGGSCATGYCCSAEGWCGRGIDYCSAPDCQLNYGSGCDGNKKPSGPDTSGVARPKFGSVLYGGAGIYDCVTAGDVALTFDDGPYLYTNDLLDKLKSYGAKATFFITGTNIGKGMINDPATPYPAIIKRMHAEGHQIASHTWSHQNASQLTNTQFTNQMVWNEIAINSILGFFPTYMRPPYSICQRDCQNILSTLGYHTIYFNLDTAGYLNDSPRTIQTSKNIWDEAIEASDPETDSFLQIEHDIHEQIVYNLTDYILTSLFSNGYRAVTVGECLGDPASNWYRAGPASSSPSSSPSSSGVPTRTVISVAPTRTGASTDGTCGNGITCAGTRWGACCSAFGFCGVGEDYCSVGNGCQAAWGRCDGDGTPVVSSSTTLRSSASSTRTSISTRYVITSTSTSTSTSTTPRSTTSRTSISTRYVITSTTTSTSTSTRRSTSTSTSRSTSRSTSMSTTRVRTTTTSTTSSSTRPTATTTPGLTISEDGLCGPENQQTCTGSEFGTCCGPSGRCSSSTIACLAILGCQERYGECV